MAPKYKLIYFPVKALGEPIRFILSYAGIEFEDYRFKSENWPELKPTTPFGKVPILEVDGKTLYQSSAICRYLAKQHGLAGDNDFESLQIDMVIDTITDLRTEMAKYSYEKDEAIKARNKIPLMNEVLPFYMPRLDNLVKENKGYFVNGKLTWADFYFVAILDYLIYMVGEDIIAKCPNLIALKEKILALPAIKEWVSKRPESAL